MSLLIIYKKTFMPVSVIPMNNRIESLLISEFNEKNIECFK